MRWAGGNKWGKKQMSMIRVEGGPKKMKLEELSRLFDSVSDKIRLSEKLRMEADQETEIIASWRRRTATHSKRLHGECRRNVA